jgi:hypothetical protein
MSDVVNAFFETGGGIAVCFSVRRLLHDKKVRGVSIPGISFFVIWGYWNLFYYPSIEQMWSLIGAGSVALVNTLWVSLMIYYTLRERRANELKQVDAT